MKRDVIVGWFMAGWAIVVGLTMVVFADRFTSPAWRYAADIPGGYLTWATILIIMGLVMCAALTSRSRRQQPEPAYMAGLILIGLWWLVLSGVFAWTAIQDPHANPLGAPVWAGVGIHYWMCAAFEVRNGN